MSDIVSPARNQALVFPYLLFFILTIFIDHNYDIVILISISSKEFILFNLFIIWVTFAHFFGLDCLFIF